MSRLFVLFILFLNLCGLVNLVRSQESLSEKQKDVFGRYEQFEIVLLRMIELNRTQNPQRTVLLQKVLEESKDRLVLLRMNDVAVSLQQKRLSRALEGQEDLEKDLAELLVLLESGNQEEKRETEKEVIQQVLQELDDLLLRQRSLKGKTSQSNQSNQSNQLVPLSQEQQELREKVQALSETLFKENHAKEGRDSQGNDDSFSPERKRLEQAKERMQRAEKALNDGQKPEALQEQEEAIAELQQAKGLLEQILRQFREEELIQMLRFLDTRFRKMLQIEKAIRTQTERLGQQRETGQPMANRELQILIGRLSADQQKVIDDADVTLALLREDGTAQALHESLLQTRSDMVQVVALLDMQELGDVTLRLEDSIIESLVEILDTVEKTRREKQNQVGSPTPDSSASEQEQRLIGLLPELKMLRTMQRRNNDRMIRLEQLLQNDRTDSAQLQTRFEELARSQNRIEKILRDIQANKMP